MALTLYGFGQSRSFRALWAMCETELEFDYIDINLRGLQKGDDYYELNIQGKVPSLDHDGFLLTESAAIINYINTLSSQSFIPGDAKLRAKYDELSFFVLAELEQPLWTMGKHKFAIPEQHRVAEIFPTAQWEFDKALNALNKLTSLEGYSVGDNFSFADVLLAHTFHWANMFQLELPEECVKFKERLYQRDGAQKAMDLIKNKA